MLVKLTKETNSAAYEKELLSTHDFLMPWFISVNDKFFYLQKKKNWKELKVGFVGNTIRFHYVMDTQLEGAFITGNIEAKSNLFYTFEVLFSFNDLSHKL